MSSLQSQSSHPPVAHALNRRCSESKSKVGPKKKFALPADINLDLDSMFLQANVGYSHAEEV